VIDRAEYLYADVHADITAKARSIARALEIGQGQPILISSPAE
jgi:hypothetical protein